MNTTSGVTRFYHRTTLQAAKAILAEGFKDATGNYLTENLYTGVWLSDVPLDANEGAEGEVLLAVDLPPQLFEQYEWVEEGKPYRESLIPADVINTLGGIRVWLKLRARRGRGRGADGHDPME